MQTYGNLGRFGVGYIYICIYIYDSCLTWNPSKIRILEKENSDSFSKKNIIFR